MGPEKGNFQSGQAWSQLRGSTECLSRPAQSHRCRRRAQQKGTAAILRRRSERGIVTVRFTRRGDRLRIIGAGYWRKGKELYEKTNR